MPLPSPKPGEEKDKWLSRCMSNEAMKEEFPDNKQRQAVCQQKWRDKDKKAMPDRFLKSRADGGNMFSGEVTAELLESARKWEAGQNKKAADEGEIERRSGPQGELRVAEDGDGKMAMISGYAAVFNELSEDLGMFGDHFREQIAPGAFTRTLADKADVRALVDHETGLMTLARTVNDTLELTEDNKGLHVRFTAPDTNAGRDIVELVRSGTLSQMSFAFRVAKGGQTWEEDEKGNTIRTVTEVTLYDVSVVTYPAYPQTSVAVRSMGAWRAEQSKALENQREINQRLLDSRRTKAQ